MSAEVVKQRQESSSLLEDVSSIHMLSRDGPTATGDVTLEDAINSESTRGVSTESTSAAAVSSRTNSRGSIDLKSITSPGPASVALLNDEEEEKPQFSGSISENGKPQKDLGRRHKRSGSKKGMVAAAALAQAATMPLPLRKKSDEEKTFVEPDPLPENSLTVTEKVEEPIKQEETSPEPNSKPGVKKSWADAESKPKSNKVASVPDSYIVDPDDGVITCVCGYDDDDGFTIQCDNCFRWQHAICYGIENEKDAPDDFLCNVCSPRFVDVKLAKKRQQERIKNAQNKRRKRVTNGEPIRESKPREASTHSSKDTLPVETTEVPQQPNELIENVASTDPLVNMVLLNPKDAYPVVYLPLKTYDYKDKYIKLFIDKHADDDWVIPYSKSSFKALPLEVKPYSDTSHSRVFPGYPKLGVYIKQSCDAGDFIDEFLGEVDYQRKYLDNPRNNYRVWGTAKPKVIFHPHLPLCIDARMSGNLTRYLRRSCKPNVELVTIRVTNGNRVEVKFVLRALEYISKGEELHIKWDWDLRHPIWRLIKNNEALDSIEESDRYLLVHSIDTILGSCDCACGSNNKDCHLLKVKRYSQSLYRSVKSKMNNRYKLNEILHGNKLQTKKQSPILSKLAHAAISDAARANEVILKFHEARRSNKSSLPVELVDKKRSTSVNAGVMRRSKFKFSQDMRSDPSIVSGDISERINPKTFSETTVKNPTELAIPVKLNLPEECTSVDDSLSNEPGFNDPNLCSHPKSQSIKRGTDDASISQTDGHNTHMKKKLSFADYKKKIKPT